MTTDLHKLRELLDQEIIRRDAHWNRSTKKILEYQKRIKEQEELSILHTVREQGMSPEQLSAMLRSMKESPLETINEEVNEIEKTD